MEALQDSRYPKVDLVEQARKGKLSPCIGREKEINRLIKVLSCQRKNNAILLGEPGIGKTAILEGLAQLIVRGDVPEDLKHLKLLSVDMGNVRAGTSFHGEFERRVKKLLLSAKDSGDIIFIDEIHMLLGVGAGHMEAANLFKPMLGRGEIRCIGATTLDEYQQFIRSDPALDRRFVPIFVDPPSVDDTITLLEGLQGGFEAYHGVKISKEALKTAVEYSDRYIKTRFLPDKAIDLVDQAAASLKLERASKPTAELLDSEALDSVQKEIMRLEDCLSTEATNKEKAKDKATHEQKEQELSRALQLQKDKLNRNTTLQEEKDMVNSIEGFDQQINSIEKSGGKYMSKASKIVYRGRLKKLRVDRDVQFKNLEQFRVEHSLPTLELGSNHIKEIIFEWTGIPVSDSDTIPISTLEKELSEQIVGQENAIKAVADAIVYFRSGLSEPDRPIASLMFLGQPGVGKTELAKALASSLFKSKDALVRMDMSEYMSVDSVSRLVGAAPGSEGYAKGGQLTEIVRRKPYSVVLFDEIEKAHVSVINIFLQILSAARLTDSKGMVVDFSDTIIIMTSNVGSNRFKNDVLAAVAQSFTPEFLDRIDRFIVFEPLHPDSIREIVVRELAKLQQKLERKKNITLDVQNSAVEFLCKIGYKPNSGARRIQRAIKENVEIELARAIESRSYTKGLEIYISDTGEMTSDGLPKLTFSEMPYLE